MLMCKFCMFFLQESIRLFKNGQKKCPKSKSRIDFWEKNTCFSTYTENPQFLRIYQNTERL